MKTFEAYNSLRDVDLQTGDRVLVIYRDAEDYMKIGTIISMTLSGHNAGDCRVLMDNSQKTDEYYYTNLRKIIELVEIPTGEVVPVPYDDLIELSGIIMFDYKFKMYYYQEKDRWQIERFML